MEREYLKTVTFLIKATNPTEAKIKWVDEVESELAADMSIWEEEPIREREVE
jgi:hypothetical protein